MNISEPEIKLMPPSPVELCEAQKKKKGFVTLVCLVTDFYPDHISIVWKVNGENRTHRVATDHAALQDPDTGLYNMSSRLRVNETEWTNIKNKFKCSVTFYKEDEYVVLEDTITFSPVKIPVRVYLTIQLGYWTVIIKSLLYAGFVSFFIWKCKATKEKTLMTENGDIMIS